MTVAVCSPPLGYLLDRFSPRRIIVPCLHRLRLRVRVAVAADAAPLAPLRGVRRARRSSATARRRWRTRAPSRAGSSGAAAWRWRWCMSGGAVGAMVLPPIAAGADRRRSAGARRLRGARRDGARPRRADRGARSSASGPAARATDARRRPTAPRCARACQSRAFWILVVVLFCSSIAQNGAIAHISALLTDRGVSRRRRRAGAVGDGRREPGRPPRRPAGCSIASSPRASRSRCSRWRRSGTFLLSRADIAAGRRAGRGADRLRDGRRGRRHAVPALALLRAAVVLDALRPDVDGLRGRRRDRPGAHGPGVRRHRLVRSAAGAPGRRHAGGRGMRCCCRATAPAPPCARRAGNWTLP